jgi:hypothetical protein
MKKIVTKFFLFAVLFAASANFSAQTYNGGTWYSLYDTEDHTRTSKGNFTEKAVFAPAESITFEYKRLTLGSIKGNIEVQNKIGSNWSGSKGSVYYDSYKEWSTSPSFALDEDISHVRCVMTSGNGGQVRNHFVKLKKHIRFADGNYGTTAVSKSCGNVTIGNVSGVQTVKLRSFLTAGNITITSNNAAFRVGSSSNQGAHVFNVGANACASANGASGSPAGGGTLGDINLYDINIYFVPIAAGEQSATITITDGTSTATVSVSGIGVKKTQQLTWAADFQADEVSLPVGKEIVDPATTNSGLALTYTSSDETVLAVEGTTIKALKAGEVILTVEQAGDDNWNAVSATKTIKVTEKTIQFIHWIDNLTRLVVGGEPIQLTATAQILLDAETDETQDAPERTALITYQSADNSVVTIDGTTLIIVGEGTTTVTASLPGDDIYEATTISMPVRVRVPSTTCEAYVLDAPEEHNYSSNIWGEYETAELSGPANQLTFEAKKEYVLGVGGVNNVQIQQLVNGDWNTIDKINPGKDYQLYGPYDLDRNATKVRFCTENGSYRRYFKNVLVSQATYLETTSPEIIVEKSIIGDEITKTIAIQHSNIPAGVTVSNTSEYVTLSTTELNTDCGLFGEEQITLTIRPMTVGTIEDVVTIHDEVTGKALNIPVTIHTQRNTQAIIWEDSIETIYATDTVILYATAQTDVYYTSSDSTIAYVNEANQLLVQSLGTVTITAHAVESETYEPAELSKEITIVATPPVVTALPTVEPVAYGVQLTNDLLVGGKANVEGTFVWNLNPEQELVPGEYNLPIQFIPNNPIFAALDTTVIVTIKKSKQYITWEQDFSEVYVNDTLYLNATAMTELYYETTEWIASIEGNELVLSAAGELDVKAIAMEDDFYLGDTLTITITVKPEEIDSIVTKFPTATSIVYGQLLGESLLEGGEATIAGEFMWKYDDQEVPAGTHWMLAQFVPEAVDLYAPVEFPVEVEVAKAPQTIDWTVGELVTIELGDTLELTATASSELPVSYVLDAEGVVTIEDNYLIAVGVGSVNVTATQDGVYVDDFGDKYANYLAADPVAITITVVPNGVPTSVEDIPSATIKARKFIRNGQLFIIRGEHTYNALGSLIR